MPAKGDCGWLPPPACGCCCCGTPGRKNRGAPGAAVAAAPGRGSINVGGRCWSIGPATSSSNCSGNNNPKGQVCRRAGAGEPKWHPPDRPSYLRRGPVQFCRSSRFCTECSVGTYTCHSPRCRSPFNNSVSGSQHKQGLHTSRWIVCVGSEFEPGVAVRLGEARRPNSARRQSRGLPSIEGAPHAHHTLLSTTMAIAAAAQRLQKQTAPAGHPPAGCRVQ
jgi:hypothetical protein